MDISLSNYIVHLPSILLTCACAVLHLSSTSQHQTVLTQIVVAFARPALRTPASLLECQRFFNRDHLGTWGPWWLAKTTVSVPEPCQTEKHKLNVEDATVMTLREALAFAIRILAPDSACSSCPMSEVNSVQVEWSAYRSPVSWLKSWFCRRTSFETYQEMVSQLGEDCPVVLHLHGGAHCLMSPASHRPFTTLLSYRSDALICAPAFRLSPQNPFPAALADVLVIYLSLISPPAGSLNAPISPARIILSGDSSGAGLAASLSLLLLTLSRHGIKLLYDGRVVSVSPQPHAGLTLISPWLDVARSLPSTILNTKYDMLAPPSLDAASPPFPEDAIWPTKPPRAETYCTSAQLCTHPLVSPLATNPGLWEGVGPVYICVGWEGVTDEAEVFARKVQQDGNAVVVFDGYEGMPHCFALMPWCWAGWQANGRWAWFVSSVVREQKRWRNQVGREQGAAMWTSSKTGCVRKVRLSELGLGQVGCGYERKKQLTDEVVDRKLQASAKWRVDLEKRMTACGKSGPDSVDKDAGS